MVALLLLRLFCSLLISFLGGFLISFWYSALSSACGYFLSTLDVAIECLSGI